MSRAGTHATGPTRDDTVNGAVQGAGTRKAGGVEDDG